MAILIDGNTNYVGAVISKRERNGYDDSDFYALVEMPQDDGTYRYIEVMYASTRWAGGGSATVDATDEVKARYQAHMDRIHAVRKAERLDVEGHAPANGMAAYITRGKHKGKSGTVVWVGENRFAHNRWRSDITATRSAMGIRSIDLDCRTDTIRVGVLLSSGDKVFVNGDQVDCFLDPTEDSEAA